MLNEYSRAWSSRIRAPRDARQVVGDMVMARSAAPLDDPITPTTAWRRALDMNRRPRCAQRAVEVRRRAELDIGIGINTGPMIAATSLRRHHELP